MSWFTPGTRARCSALVAALASLLALAAPAGAVAPAAQAPPATAIIGTASPAAARALATELRAHGLSAVAMRRLGAVEVGGGEIAAVRALVGSDRRVEWIEPPRDRVLLVSAPSEIDVVTDRPYDWALDGVTALEAPSAGVTVAVVDSGVDANHLDLAGRLGPGFDTVSDGSVVKDFVGHGTFVAGLISAKDDGGPGARGVAGATTVLPIRITTNGTIKSADAAEGIVHAVDAGAGVINLSFGGTLLSEVERAALDYAAAHDVLVVAAAGNSFQAGNPVLYPAAALGAPRGAWSRGLSVAATDPLGRHARFSTTNDFVSVAAPGAGLGECGDGVFSTVPGYPVSLWDGQGDQSCTRIVESLGSSAGRYGYAEGTSFATPLVAGAAALVRRAHPDLSSEQTADVIRRSARQTIGSGWNAQTGWGVLDVAAALSRAATYDTVAPSPGLSVAPRPGGVVVSASGSDLAGAGELPAGIATYGLEVSGDGTAFAPRVSPGAAPINLDEALPPGSARWYRATACDAHRNCASEVAGPFGPGSSPSSGTVGAPAPRIASFVAARPRTCAACVRVAITVRGAGPMSWALTLSSARAGVRAVRRSGVVPADGRVVATLPLTKVPSCRGRLGVSLAVASRLGTARSVRTLSVGAPCVGSRRR